MKAMLALAIAALLAFAPSAGAATRVDMVNFAFKPRTVEIARGAKVTFVNASSRPHTATRVGGGFDTGRVGPGGSASVRFQRRGTFRYFCKIHPEMRGKVVVG